MSITLSDGITTLELDSDLRWEDEHAWSAVQQAMEPSVTGAPILDIGQWLAGRPITLSGVDSPGDSYGWMSGVQLAQLQAWANAPGLQLALTLRGVTRTVVFRHHTPPALEAAPLVFVSDPEPGDWYVVTCRFMEI